nr:MAG TPA: hypothetical protein [Caudoviricetes sp.]
MSSYAPTTIHYIFRKIYNSFYEEKIGVGVY